ncbi:urease accessory protein UreF [Gloeocapsa sp. PCC 73106]|uniref:urease accessory protein UreF n=1 Tax=Gloeocapsa sp. PCC 73106 TaxID=102232 RepID=UPI0002AC40E9|nr:urease accessory protein UreF [Gloeocapsa sp. PCC 73106]ELR97968.1 urease accessory protein UreF [Gloeocapsa sp. PCC 73106]
MSNLLNLLQLASPTIPIGAYSYSEGLENLIALEIITNKEQLKNWLNTELNHGSIGIETAVMIRGYQSIQKQQIDNLEYWNNWLSASRETSELREQSWQMGKSLLKLLLDLGVTNQIDPPCNYAIAYAIGAATWDIPLRDATLAYLHSWTTNLVTAGIKLIPLGQTHGQQILRDLHDSIRINADRILDLEDHQLFTCNWGLSLASMNHQSQYTRLFRS